MNQDLLLQKLSHTKNSFIIIVFVGSDAIDHFHPSIQAFSPDSEFLIAVQLTD